jgi:tetratricopeptide (TPR) repeat protein
MEEILTNLSKVHDLRVISRTSVEQFRESAIPTTEIAKSLNVEYIAEGSGQKYGNEFLLRVQLIEASTDRQIWDDYLSKNYLDSVLILCNIALSYDNRLSEAYTMKGEYYRVKENSAQALKEYDKAIELNPNDYEGYYGRGLLYYYANNHIPAIDNFQKAISLHRGVLLSRFFSYLGYAYMSAGFLEKGKDYCKAYFDIKNDTIGYYYRLSEIEFLSDNIENSVDYLEKAYTKDSTDITVLYLLGLNYLYSNQNEKSLKIFKKVFEEYKTIKNYSSYNYLGNLGLVYWRNGLKNEAKDFFNKELEHLNIIIELGQASRNKFETYWNLASIYAIKGEKVKAYKYLDIYTKSQTMTLWDVINFRHDPMFENIRNEPKFQSLLKVVESKYQAEHERVRKWLEDQKKI